MSSDKSKLIGDETYSSNEADPDIVQAARNLARKGGVSYSEVAWAQRGMPNAWSNTKQQEVELEGIVRGMIEEKFGPKYIRDYVISAGYGHRQFTEAFRRLTGVSWEDYTNETFTESNVPGQIPGVNYGWGKSKGSEYDYYFIQPYNMGFSVFGQKGDLIRKEVNYEYTLKAAREYLEKNTKETFYLDKPVELKGKGEGIPKQQLSEPLHTYLTASENPDFIALDDWVYENIKKIPEREVKSRIISSYRDKSISAEEFGQIWSGYGFEKSAEGDLLVSPDIDERSDTRKELDQKVRKTFKEEMETPLDEDLTSQSPTEEFISQIEKSKGDKSPDKYIAEAYQFIKDKNESLRDFSLLIEEHKWRSVTISEDRTKRVELEDGEQKDFFSSQAILALYLKIEDRISREAKYGKALFTVIDGSLITPDVIKGEDMELHALTEEGLNNYFFNERERKEQERAL